MPQERSPAHLQSPQQRFAVATKEVWAMQGKSQGGNCTEKAVMCREVRLKTQKWKSWVYVIMGLLSVLGRSLREGSDYPLQDSCLENSMDRGAWWAIIHGAAKETDMTQWLNLPLSLCHWRSRCSELTGINLGAEDKWLMWWVRSQSFVIWLRGQRALFELPGHVDMRKSELSKGLHSGLSS